jgi:tetratricopeptide (TPR) repeat protein
MSGTFGKGQRGIVHVMAFLLTAVIASGCATTIKTNVLMPGRVDQAAQFKTVAVLPFDGPDGRTFTPVLESTLASVVIDNKQYFQIVDRGLMNKTLAEMQLGMSGVVDANTAAQVGKVVGAKGIYAGAVNASSVSDEAYTEKRQKCASYRTVTDDKGRQRQECTRYYDTQVRCTKRSAAFGFTPKLVEVESSRIVFSQTYESEGSVKKCQDEGALPDAQAMKKKLQDEALHKFRMDVAPYYATVSFTLKDSTSDIPSEAAKDKLKAGLEFAKGNRMDRACALWNEAKPLAPNAVSVLYDLGVCAEIEGRPEQALAFYQQIDKMLTKPDDSVSKALERVNQQMENRKKLSGQQSAK